MLWFTKRTIVKLFVILFCLAGGSNLFIAQAYQYSILMPPTDTQNGSAEGVLFFARHVDENGLFDAERTGYYRSDLTGTEFAQLASWAEIMEKSENLIQLEAISPDGSTVLYLTQLEGFEATDIVALDLPSGASIPYTNTNGDSANWHPVWSPDSSRVAYLSGSSLRNFAQEVKIYDTSTQQTETLFTMERDGYIVDVAWSVDGSELVVMLFYGDAFESILGLTIVDDAGNVQTDIVLGDEFSSIRPVLRDNFVYLVCGDDHSNKICRMDRATLAVEEVINLDTIQSDVQVITAFDVTRDEQQIVVSFLNYLPDFSGYAPPDGKAFMYLVDLGTTSMLDLTGDTGETRQVIRFTGSTPTTSTANAGTNVTLQHEGACGAEVAEAGNYWGVRANDGVYIYDFATLPQPSQFIAGQFQCVIAFTADGEQFAVSTRSEVQLYETQTGNLLGSFADDDDSIRSFALSPSGAFLTISGINTRSTPRTQIWNVSAGSIVYSYERQDNGSLIYSASSLAYTPDGTQIGAATEGSIYVWSLLTGNEVARLPFGTNPETIQFSPNGDYLVVTSVINGRYMLWNTSTWDTVAEGCFLGGNADFSPDGQFLSLPVCVNNTDSPKTVQVISTATGQVSTTVEVGADYPSSLAYSPTGTMLAIGYPDGRLEVWDIQTNTLTASDSAHTGRVARILFSVDAHYLITIGADNQVIVRTN